MLDYCVIIPALNEEAHIRACVERLRSLSPCVPITVVDGGSRDQTVQMAERAGARVIRSQPGRGVQLNSGARGSRNAILIFLHADTLLPDNSFAVLDRFFSGPQAAIGTFRLRFDDNRWFFRVCGYLTRFDSLFTRFGDQCIVVRRSLFDELGGFPEWPLFEDVDFLRRARRKTKIRSFPAEVLTSSRKFKKNGLVRQQIRNGILIVKYLLGVRAETLAKEYGQ